MIIHLQKPIIMIQVNNQNAAILSNGPLQHFLLQGW